MCTFDALLTRVLVRAAEPGTSVIGITGAPGAGKSTLTEALVAAARARLGGDAVAHVPMDGFHLADVELRRLGRLERKGAPDTFDVAGYAALLSRIRRRTETVYAPGFERDAEQPIAGAIPVFPHAAVVLTEGNYLLLDNPGWSAVAAEIDEIWYCAIQDDVRVERLVARHIAFGKPADEARVWVAEVDEPNARLVAATAARADLAVSIDAVMPNSH
ncbi:nucleoside/nucleotide kinase family protein [Mycolicibacterium setense]|uniref:nucleoside/nucleotide kinase family protein n=1 Tax=Mycolicibacterium setense TaxID=431269 RepID=UPI0007EB4728|nr:nucleoside/nucleotide kinase family protein [Mycolicibacterium setense]OBB20374.1 nucleoside/nucleotide kinase family protein [Mycolicibacterium setense]